MGRSSFLLSGLLLLILTGCNLSPEKARIELARMYIVYSPESFIEAVQKNDTQVVDLFLKSGMDVNSMDGVGRTALMEAKKMGHDELVNVLVEKGAIPQTIPRKVSN
jgi:hypothetical protein